MRGDYLLGRTVEFVSLSGASFTVLVPSRKQLAPLIYLGAEGKIMKPEEILTAVKGVLNEQLVSEIARHFA